MGPSGPQEMGSSASTGKLVMAYVVMAYLVMPYIVMAARSGFVCFKQEDPCRVRDVVRRRDAARVCQPDADAVVVAITCADRLSVIRPYAAADRHAHRLPHAAAVSPPDRHADLAAVGPSEPRAIVRRRGDPV